ncbi:MAG: hypothetical protein MUE40_18735 [Anaerolineae bacterium]|jgi:hypothetical protein|nr:hypothetical protein [Anaerolineae bacterium]
MDNPPENRPVEQRDTTTPATALQRLRQKREQLTRDYAAGKLNAAQFNAMYRYYMEKSTIIEKMMQNNPESEAWRSVAAPGATAFLREKFESRLLYCVVLRRGDQTPLMAEGRLSQKAAYQLHEMLKKLWALPAWRSGLVRKAMGDGLWMLLCMGETSATITIFMLQPSTIQTNRVRDLHLDFERANQLLLLRNLPASRMVFPQRALFEQG